MPCELRGWPVRRKSDHEMYGHPEKYITAEGFRPRKRRRFHSLSGLKIFDMWSFLLLMYNLCTRVIFPLSLFLSFPKRRRKIRVGDNYLDPSFNDVRTISKLTFENKNKGKITLVHYRGTLSVMVITIGNGICDPSSNPGQGGLHFTLCWYS